MFSRTSSRVTKFEIRSLILHVFEFQNSFRTTWNWSGLILISWQQKCSRFIIRISIPTFVTPLDVLPQTITLRCLIEGHARLFISESLSSLPDVFHVIYVITEKLSTLLTVFHVLNKKIGQTCPFIRHLRVFRIGDFIIVHTLSIELIEQGGIIVSALLFALWLYLWTAATRSMSFHGLPSSLDKTS